MNIKINKTALHLMNKVPEVTLYFWIIKIMATTVGETGADFLSFNLHLGLSGTSWVMSVLLALVLVIQIRSEKYIPWMYWLTVVLISVVGTLITDNLVDHLGVTLATATSVFSAALLATFIFWYASEKTLSIHTIFTRRRELFYWAAILFTFALGTAAGDLSAEGLQLGYANSAMIFGALIAVVMLGYYVFKMNAVLAFWLAYILTRPLGASLGDYLSQPSDKGGLGLGTAVVNVVFFLVIAALVTYLTRAQLKRHDVSAKDEARVG